MAKFDNMITITYIVQDLNYTSDCPRWRDHQDAVYIQFKCLTRIIGKLQLSYLITATSKNFNFIFDRCIGLCQQGWTGLYLPEK
jgi:hypothetical protein